MPEPERPIPTTKIPEDKEDESPQARTPEKGDATESKDDENSAPSKATTPKTHRSPLPDGYEEEEEEVTEFKDADALAQEKIVKNSTPTTELEIALTKILERKEALIERLRMANSKMTKFVSKRKQTYKRKRKDDGAPVRALSGYNLYIRERFEQLRKENEVALKSDDTNATLKRVPPANLIKQTGTEWKNLPKEIKQQYEDRAKSDRERYEKEMAEYQPPNKETGRKRLKTGYNIFFTQHVLRMKQSDGGVPSERGSVARIVGNAWKALSSDDRMFYEREADKHNGMNPVPAPQDEDDEEEEIKPPAHPMEPPYPYPPPPPPVHPGEMHMHTAVPAPPMHAQPDPRAAAHHYYAPPPPHIYGQNPYGHYDYSQHHQRHQGRHQGYQQYPGHHRHPYDM